jgi:hypothetical protein
VRSKRVTLEKGFGDVTFRGMDAFSDNKVVIGYRGSHNFNGSSRSFAG